MRWLHAPRPLAAIHPPPWLDKLLDPSVDEAARDGDKTFTARIVALMLMTAIVAANFSTRHALLWTCCGLLAELLIYIAKRDFRKAGPASIAARTFYVAAALAGVLVWTTLPLVLWYSSNPGLNAAAIVILATMIIHAQAFAFRSLTTLAVVGGPPALLLLLLPWLSGEPIGVDRMTFSFFTVLIVGYAGASTIAHRATARSLGKVQDELERFAYFDALTSLANRRRFAESLRSLIELSQRRPTPFALLLLDLDLFKQVNDTLGHDAGDALLIEIGARLRAAVRAGDEVARIGGDEFAVLLRDADDKAAIALVCERIASIASSPVEFGGTQMQSSVSVGVAVFPDDGADQDSLYKAADLALYRAKRGGRNAWHYSQGATAGLAPITAVQAAPS